MIQQVLDHQYAVIDQFLSQTEVALLTSNLLNSFRSGQFKKAGIGREQGFSIRDEIRGDLITWLNPDQPREGEDIYLQRIGALSDYLNQTCFTNIRGAEFHYALYPEGTFYKRHLDRFQSSDNRLFSIVCYLNEVWESDFGGQLILYPEGREPVVVDPLGGRLVFFKSDELEHEILPTRKTRLSVTGWLRR
jgi:SM-20-related protein